MEGYKAEDIVLNKMIKYVRNYISLLAQHYRNSTWLPLSGCLELTKILLPSVVQVLKTGDLTLILTKKKLLKGGVFENLVFIF